MSQEPIQAQSPNLVKLHVLANALEDEWLTMKERVETLTREQLELRREHAALVLVLSEARKALLAQDLDTLFRIIREAGHGET